MGIFVTLHSKWPGSRIGPPGREEMKNQEAEKSKKTIDEIVHRALVTQVGGGYARVRISDQAECKGCAAASLCGIGDKGREPLDVQVPTGMRVRPGDHVEIAGTERLHQKAIRLLTVYPTLAIIAVMVGIYLLTGNELDGDALCHPVPLPRTHRARVCVHPQASADRGQPITI